MSATRHRFCLGCVGQYEYLIERVTDIEGREHTYRGAAAINVELRDALTGVARAAFRVKDYHEHDVGGDPWWDAIGELVAALDPFYETCAESLGNEFFLPSVGEEEK